MSPFCPVRRPQANGTMWRLGQKGGVNIERICMKILIIAFTGSVVYVVFLDYSRVSKLYKTDFWFLFIFCRINLNLKLFIQMLMILPPPFSVRDRWHHILGFPVVFLWTRSPVTFTSCVFRLNPQLESLEGMYSEILTNMDVESKGSKSSNNKDNQRAAAIQGTWVCPGYIYHLISLDNKIQLCLVLIRVISRNHSNAVLKK